MLINPFKKERRKNKLMKFIPVFQSDFEKIFKIIKKKAELVEIDDELSQSFKIKKGTKVLVIKEKNLVKLKKLMREFESDKSIVLEWLEDIRPHFLEDFHSKGVYALIDNKIDEITTEYDKLISFMDKYEIFTRD